MVQSEEEVLKAAQAILEQKQYQKLRNYIYVSEACSLTHMAQLWGRGNVANANRAFSFVRPAMQFCARLSDFAPREL